MKYLSVIIIFFLASCSKTKIDKLADSIAANDDIERVTIIEVENLNDFYTVAEIHETKKRYYIYESGEGNPEPAYLGYDWAKSEDGKWLAAASGDFIKVYDLSKGFFVIEKFDLPVERIISINEGKEIVVQLVGNKTASVFIDDIFKSRLSAPVPSDVSDLPSPLDKLQYIGQQDYILQFIEIRDSGRVKVLRYPSGKYEAHGYILRIGETSHDDQIRIDGYREHKQSPENYSLKNSATLSITYLPDGRKFKLKRKEKITIPTYFAQFKLTVDPKEGFYVKKGDSFRLPIDTDADYRLIDVGAETATVSFINEDGTEVKFEIKIKE